MDENTVELEEEDQKELAILKKLWDLENNEAFVVGFALLQDVMFDIAELKGWHSPAKSFGEQVLMMHTELSEVVEEYRTRRFKEWTSEDRKPEGVIIELADVLIRELDTCELHGMDLLEGVFRKARFNLTRTHRHGGKTL